MLWTRGVPSKFRVSKRRSSRLTASILINSIYIADLFASNVVNILLTGHVRMYLSTHMHALELVAFTSNVDP